MQEVITLVIFAIFSVTYLGERFTLNHGVGFLFDRDRRLLVSRGPYEPARAD